eukprot:gene11967-13880_t
MGALRTNFDHLKKHISQNCTKTANANANPGWYVKQLLEESFRFLYLLADSSSDGVIRSFPSSCINQALQCLMLDPVLYWRVCEEILSMQSKNAAEVQTRVLPYDALGGEMEDEGVIRTRFDQTLDQYKKTFGEEPPVTFWDKPVIVAPAQELPLRAASTSSAGATSTAVPMASPAPKAESLLDDIRLCFVVNGKKQDLKVALGDKFPVIAFQLSFHLKWKSYDFKKVELTYRNMTLRAYMMPYSFNMKDGDVIECKYDPSLEPAKESDTKPASTATSGTAVASIRASLVSPPSSALPLSAPAPNVSAPAGMVPPRATVAPVPAHGPGVSISKASRPHVKSMVLNTQDDQPNMRDISNSNIPLVSQPSPPQASQDQDEKTWECTFCTLLNDVAEATIWCALCGNKRKNFNPRPKSLHNDFFG